MTNRNQSFLLAKADSSQLGMRAAFSSIGLSALAADCYMQLYRFPYSSVRDIAEQLDRPYRSVHRLFRDLEHKGFFCQIYTGIHPARYRSRLIHDALEHYAAWQRLQMKELIERQQVQYLEQQLSDLKVKR